MTKKISFMSLIFLILYGTFFLSILMMILIIIVKFIYFGVLNITADDIRDAFIRGLISGVAAGLGSWIFAKLDERKARKSPPSDEDQD